MSCRNCLDPTERSKSKYSLLLMNCISCFLFYFILSKLGFVLNTETAGEIHSLQGKEEWVGFDLENGLAKSQFYQMILAIEFRYSKLSGFISAFFLLLLLL